MKTTGRINVLFVMIQMEMGGSERLIWNLARSLDRRRFSPSIAWFHGDRVLPEFRDLGIPLHHVPKVKRIDFSAMNAMARIIRQNQIQIVNAHHFMSLVYSFYGSKISGNAGLVYTEHSEWELENLPRKWKVAGGCLVHRTDACVGVSEPVARRLRGTFSAPGARILAIINGVRPRAAIDGAAQQAIRKELGLSHVDRVIGIVANLKKVKNHLLLLRAFHQLARDCNSVKLMIVGQGFAQDQDNAEPEMRRFIAEKGLADRVILTGYRPDVPALLSLMDIFCLTSFTEGLPISLIEAMAAGIPVVGSDVEGIRDVILHGKNGYLVPLDDPGKLRATLLALLNDEPMRRRMGQESRLLATRLYSFDRCVSGYQDLFAEIARGKAETTQGPAFGHGKTGLRP